MALFVPIIAAALAGPVISLGFEDYPTSDIRKSVSGAAIVDAVVDPKGRVVRCETRQTFGDDNLAQKICPLINRKRHKPATLADGSKTYGQIVTMVKFWRPETPIGDTIRALQHSPDLIVNVQKVPNWAPANPFYIAFTVNTDGTVANCGAGHDDPAHEAVQAVCNSGIVTGLPVVKDANGTAVQYVTEFSVSFATS